MATDIADGRVSAVILVEALDVGEDVTLCFLAGRVLAMMDQLGLEGVEEAFHRALS